MPVHPRSPVPRCPPDEPLPPKFPRSFSPHHHTLVVTSPATSCPGVYPACHPFSGDNHRDASRYECKSDPQIPKAQTRSNTSLSYVALYPSITHRVRASVVTVRCITASQSTSLAHRFLTHHHHQPVSCQGTLAGMVSPQSSLDNSSNGQSKLLGISGAEQRPELQLSP